MRDQQSLRIRRQLAKEGVEITEDSIRSARARTEQKHARVVAEKKAAAEAVGIKPITTKYVKDQLRQRKRLITPETVAAHWAFLADRRERIANEAELGIPRPSKVQRMTDSYIVCMLKRAGIPCTPVEINNRRQRLIEGRAQRALPLATRAKLYGRNYRKSENGQAVRIHARDSLSDYYVRSALRLPALYCPPELVELKRFQMNIKRKLKELK